MNHASIGRSNSSRSADTEQVLLFAVSNQVFAIVTDAVQELRSTDSLAGTASEIQNSPIRWVRHMIKRGQRNYYVVNAAAHFGLPMTRPALLLIMRGSRTSVLIDRIERMAAISKIYPLPRAFAGKERQWYCGLAYADDRVIPIIEPSAFLSAEDITRLDEAVGSPLLHPELEGTARA